MRNLAKLFAAASVLGLSAHMAVAQTAVFVNNDRAEDVYDDLLEQIEDDAERDIEPFGNVGRPIGFDGSMALRGSLSDGNTDSADLGFGANLGYYDGLNGYRLLLNYIYGEDDGIENENSLIYGLEYTRDFADRWYGYAKVQGSEDDYANYTSDTFAGFGVGYKVVERPDVSWQVAFGPGYRWASLADGTDIEEEALSLTSNYTARISDTMLGTLDTNVIFSESDTVIYNDIGVNFAMSEALALRTSMATEWHSEPLPGTKEIDNTLGLSLVYSFN